MRVRSRFRKGEKMMQGKGEGKDRGGEGWGGGGGYGKVGVHWTGVRGSCHRPDCLAVQLG